MHQVEVGTVPLTRLGGLLSKERAALLDTYAARARAVFGDRVLWHVSATGRGGGVAEMLQTFAPNWGRYVARDDFEGCEMCDGTRIRFRYTHAQSKAKGTQKAISGSMRPCVAVWTAYWLTL